MVDKTVFQFLIGDDFKQGSRYYHRDFHHQDAIVPLDVQNVALTSLDGRIEARVGSFE